MLNHIVCSFLYIPQPHHPVFLEINTFFLVYTKPETSYAPPQPNEAAAAAPTTEQDEYGVPSGDLVPLGSYFVAPPQEFILFIYLTRK